MDRVLLFLATGAGSGYLPKAPGTWGSAVGVLLFLLIHRLDLGPYLIVLAALFVLGVFCAGSAEKILDLCDPRIVVIDEILGQLIALCLVPASPGPVIASFLLFRFFDILKPFPIGWVDQHLHGGIGIMLDDVLAGLYTLVLVHIGIRLHALL